MTESYGMQKPNTPTAEYLNQYQVIYVVIWDDEPKADHPGGYYYLKSESPPLWTTEHDEAIAFPDDGGSAAAKVASRFSFAGVLCSAKIPSRGEGNSLINLAQIRKVFSVALKNIRSAISEMSDRADFNVIETKGYDRTYSGHPDDLGTIEVAYHCPSVAQWFGDNRPDNNHALFGVHADGSVRCQAN